MAEQKQQKQIERESEAFHLFLSACLIGDSMPPLLPACLMNHDHHFPASLSSVRLIIWQKHHHRHHMPSASHPGSRAIKAARVDSLSLFPHLFLSTSLSLLKNHTSFSCPDSLLSPSPVLRVSVCLLPFSSCFSLTASRADRDQRRREKEGERNRKNINDFVH